MNDEVVVFHDYTLDRLCEATGRVDQLTLAALRATRLRDSNEQIPTLYEVLEEVGGRVPLFLELKSRFIPDLVISDRLVNGFDAHILMLRCFSSWVS